MVEFIKQFTFSSWYNNIFIRRCRNYAFVFFKSTLFNIRISPGIVTTTLMDYSDIWGHIMYKWIEDLCYLYLNSFHFMHRMLLTYLTKADLSKEIPCLGPWPTVGKAVGWKLAQFFFKIHFQPCFLQLNFLATTIYLYLNFHNIHHNTKLWRQKDTKFQPLLEITKRKMAFYY